MTLLPIADVVCRSVNAIGAIRPHIEARGVVYSWQAVMVRMAPRIKRQFQIQRMKRHFWIQIGALPFFRLREVGWTGAKSLQSLLGGGKLADRLLIGTQGRHEETNLGLGYCGHVACRALPLGIRFSFATAR